MIEVNYRFKVEWIQDTIYDYEPAICVHYTVRWYYGDMPWKHEGKSYSYYIPTCEAKNEGEINPFAHLKARDIPDDIIYNLLCLDIEHEHLQDGVDIVTQNKKRQIYKWSKKFVRRMDYDEFTGLTKERESAIIELKKEWYGEDK